jgi:hypothetical protein
MTTKTLKNGAIYDLEKHRIVSNPGGGSHAITKDNSGEMRARRTELARERTRQGIAEGLGMDLNKASGGEEWQELTRLFTEQFKNSKNLRGMAESYAKLGQASGYLLPQAEAASGILVEFAKLMQDFMQREVVDGHVIDE